MSSELKENIESTIGCDYEVVVIDNSQNGYNIFTAYNEGVRRSHGDILCFMHEDILYYTKGWGNLVEKHFCNENVGLIGVEGCHFMPKYQVPWWSSAACSGQLIQGRDDNGTCVSIQEQLWDRKENDLIEAVIVDGLWMCIRKSLFDSIRFDDVTFNHFHCYDMDICMQVLNNNKDVCIAYDILIEHKSIGNPNLKYFEELDKWFKKWENMLPIVKGMRMSGLEQKEREVLCIRYAELFKSNEKLLARIESILNSKPYRLGKALLKPFKVFKKK